MRSEIEQITENMLATFPHTDKRHLRHLVLQIKSEGFIKIIAFKYFVGFFLWDDGFGQSSLLRGETLLQNLPAGLSSQVCGQCDGIAFIPSMPHFWQDGFAYRPGEDLELGKPELPVAQR